VKEMKVKEKIRKNIDEGKMKEIVRDFMNNGEL
jgi:hypothetical protein